MEELSARLSSAVRLGMPADPPSPLAVAVSDLALHKVAWRCGPELRQHPIFNLREDHRRRLLSFDGLPRLPHRMRLSPEALRRKERIPTMIFGIWCCRAPRERAESSETSAHLYLHHSNEVSEKAWKHAGDVYRHGEALVGGLHDVVVGGVEEVGHARLVRRKLQLFQVCFSVRRRGTQARRRQRSVARRRRGTGDRFFVRFARDQKFSQGLPSVGTLNKHGNVC